MVSFLRKSLPLGAKSVLVALCALVDANPASACSCAQPFDPEVAVDVADIVFEGQPTEVTPLQMDLGFGGYLGAKRFRFDVTRYFKGQLGPSVPIFTADQSSACGREYSLGELHVIYARYTDEGLLTDFACSRSGPSAFAEEDLALLGAGLTPDASYPEDLDTVPSASSGSELGSGINRVPVVADPASKGCASLARRDSTSRSWQPLATFFGALAALAASRRRRGY